MNKKQMDLLDRHINRNEGTLYDTYTSPSQSKISIWNDIVTEARELGSYPAIRSFNTFMFTASFIYEKNGRERLRYYMPSETFDFEIS